MTESERLNRVKSFWISARHLHWILIGKKRIVGLPKTATMVQCFTAYDMKGYGLYVDFADESFSMVPEGNMVPRSVAELEDADSSRAV